MNGLSYFVRAMRHQKNMSLREFAERANISHTHLDSIEKGKDNRTGKSVNLSIEVLNSFSNYLEIPTWFLTELSLNSVFYSYDESMEPFLPYNFFISINKKINDLVANGIYLIEVNNDLYLRKLYFEEGYVFKSASFSHQIEYSEKIKVLGIVDKLSDKFLIDDVKNNVLNYQQMNLNQMPLAFHKGIEGLTDADKSAVEQLIKSLQDKNNK